jgi:hypothetical protein
MNKGGMRSTALVGLLPALGLAELISRCRAAHDAGSELAPEDASELEAPVQAEVEATSKRAQAIEHELSR